MAGGCYQLMLLLLLLLLRSPVVVIVIVSLVVCLAEAVLWCGCAKRPCQSGGRAAGVEKALPAMGAEAGSGLLRLPGKP